MRNLLTILFLLPLFAIGQYSATLTQVDTSGAVVDIPMRPNTGLGIDFQNLNQTIPWPNPAGTGQHGTVLYMRITAHSISVNWSEWDSYFTLAGSRNEKVAVRINVVDDSYNGNTIDGNKMAYPNAWHTTMQGEANPDFKIGNVWWPNYNSTTFKANWRALMVTVVAHMNATTVGSTGKTQKQLLQYWDIGGIGNYGEMHTFINIGGDWAWPAGTEWTNSSLQEMVNAQKDNITNVPLLFNINVGASNSRMPSGFPSWIMTQSNGWGQFGLRYDNSGNKAIFDFEFTNNIGSENGITYKTEFANRWKVSLVASEPIQFSFSAGGQPDYYYIKAEYPLLHVSNIENFKNIENNGAVPANTASLFYSMSKLTGYRWTVKSVNMTDSIRPNGNFNVAPLFANIGIAPIYEHINVTYELWNGSGLVKSWASAFDPFMVLPGQVTGNDNVTMTGTFSGVYSLWVKFSFPDGYWPPLPLQMNTRQSDGRYLLRQGIAVAVQGAPPPPPPPPPPNNPPQVLGGPDQTDSLPKNIDTLIATVQDIDGDAVAYSWTQLSGPNTATMGTASGTATTNEGPVTISNRISGLIEGTYQFRLNLNDGKGGLTQKIINVFVIDVTPPTPPPPPPPTYSPPTIAVSTVAATTFRDTVIYAPATTANLYGHVITKDTAIQSVQWIKFSGTGSTITTPTDSTTTVTGLAPLGVNTQVFQYYFRVTDKAGNIVTSPVVRIIVVPAVLPDPPPLPAVPDKAKIFGLKAF